MAAILTRSLSLPFYVQEKRRRIWPRSIFSRPPGQMPFIRIVPKGPNDNDNLPGRLQ